MSRPTNWGGMELRRADKNHLTWQQRRAVSALEAAHLGAVIRSKIHREPAERAASAAEAARLAKELTDYKVEAIRRGQNRAGN